MALSSLAVASVAFNLICSGTLSTTTALGSEKEPYTSTFRLDLDSRRWCEGDCRFVKELSGLSDTLITLEAKNADTPRTRDLLLNVIARDTGIHTINAAAGTGAGAVVMKWSGVCEKAAFTGFPAVKQKF